jgi:serine/threonine-protein kinase
MGLTRKILLFTSLLVVALLFTTLAFTTFQANRLAHNTITHDLLETRDVWETFQADRYNKLKLGIRVLANDPAFKAAITNKEVEDSVRQATVLDMLRERGQDIKADFFIATGPDGVIIARSDRPGAAGQDLSHDPLVMKPLEGEESAAVWRQGDALFHAVAVPMLLGPDIVGVLVAGYAINESLANDIRKLTHSEVAYLSYNAGGPPQLAVSSLGPEEPALKAMLSRAEFASPGGGTAPFEVDLAGDLHLAIDVPLKSSTGATLGSLVALRSVASEMAGFNRFRNSLILVSLVVMVLGLGLAYVTASRITGPVRNLVHLVERARDGSYAGAVTVASSDEIGVLARTFNSLLADLREKEQMIGFLRDGMTEMRKVPGASDSGSMLATAETASIAAMPTQTGMRIEKGSLFAGRYEILSTLGRGGMGIVYRAQDRTLDEIVALKVLRPDVLQEDHTLLERFKTELKLARRITHRNVLRTHDFGEANGTPYISMEYLEGVTLKDLIINKGALPLGVGLRIAKQMCQGLEAAHREGVVHRDIKPHNMLILPESGDLKIMDFGIARVSEVKGVPDRDAGLTTAGTVMGTPDYMPPEQAQGYPADFRSDIYALGVVLFEVFTGTLPFKGETPMAVVVAHIQTPPPPPRRINPQVPEDLQAVILRLMDKEPNRRYQRVSEILEELTAISSRLDAGASAA